MTVQCTVRATEPTAGKFSAENLTRPLVQIRPPQPKTSDTIRVSDVSFVEETFDTRRQCR